MEIKLSFTDYLNNYECAILKFNFGNHHSKEITEIFINNNCQHELYITKYPKSDFSVIKYWYPICMDTRTIRWELFPMNLYIFSDEFINYCNKYIKLVTFL